VATLVGAQVAAALAAAHADGIVHRDVKPANVMVTSTGVKLFDFGISAAVGALDGTDGQLLGTPAYLAPERVRGGPVRPATDVYALGLLMYLALAGQMPWQASTVTQMVKANVYAKPAPLPAIPGLPPAVARLVSRCLSKSPADRPSAIEVSEVLGEVAGLPSSALLRSVAAPTVTLPAVTGRPRGRTLLIAAGVVAGVLVAGGAWWADDGPVKPATAGAVAAPPAAATTATPAVEPSTPTVRPVSVERKKAGTAAGKAPRAAAAPAPKAKPGPAGPAKAAKHPKPKKPGKK
jgi:serine/threonine-protein kinase